MIDVDHAPGGIWLPGSVVAEVPAVTGPGRLVVESFRKLGELPPERDWLWHGFLAGGLLTMLAGHPFAGKSMLVAGLLKAIDEGDPFLARETTRASALLITEEDKSLVRERAERFGLRNVRSELVTRASSVGLEWSSLIGQATETALRDGHQLLVIDTFPGLAGLGDEQENDAGAIGQRLRPLQQAAGKGLAVLFLHHMNAHDQPRGSKALRGVVDISIRLLRREPSRTLRLETTSRSVTATPPTLRAELVKAADGWFYEPRGGTTAKGGEEPAGESTDQRLRRVLAEACPRGLTYRELGRVPGLSADIAKKRLPVWHAKAQVVRAGLGGKREPYRWFICPG
jgi:AAA domain